MLSKKRAHDDVSISSTSDISTQDKRKSHNKRKNHKIGSLKATAGSTILSGFEKYKRSSSEATRGAQDVSNMVVVSGDGTTTMSSGPAIEIDGLNQFGKLSFLTLSY